MRIEDLGNGSYRVFIEAGRDYRGKRKRHSKTFHAKTKKELNAKIKDWENSLEDGNTGSSGTLSAMIRDVWGNVTYGKKKTTVEGYNYARKRIDATIGSCRLSDLSPRIVQAWINDLSTSKSATGRPLSPKSIKDTYSVLKLCCDVAENWDIIKKNPCHNIKLPTNNKKEVSILSPEELEVFCAHLHELDPDTRVLFELAVFCGLRRSEIMGILDSDITGPRLIINKTRHESNGETYIDTVKTSSGNRICVIPDFVLNDIKELRTHHKREKLRLGGLWQESPYLIRYYDGSAFVPFHANKRLVRYLSQIGLPKINFHALRHTYASVIIANGVDLATVSKRMGHSNVSTTLSIYTHMFQREEEKDPIASIFDSMIH